MKKLETERVALYCGDCMRELEAVEDGTVDMVLIDPPYSSGGLFAGDRKASTRTKYTDSDAQGAARFQNFSGDNMDQRSFTEFMRMVFAATKEKAKPGAVAAAFIDWRNLPAMTDALQAGGWVWRGIAVWDKGVSRNIPGRFRSDCEYLVWGTYGEKPVDWKAGGPALPGCYRVSSVPSAKKNHQTEKPVELLEKILAICPEGGTVLDCFMGSGSTGVACITTGRRFIGIELDKGYFETAARRITEEAAQYTLFDAGGGTNNHHLVDHGAKPGA